MGRKIEQNSVRSSLGGELRAPTPGYRDPGNYGRLGDLVSVGNSSYNWSLTVSGTNGLDLGFHVTYLNLGHSAYRAAGHQLRCLSE